MQYDRPVAGTGTGSSRFVAMTAVTFALAGAVLNIIGAGRLGLDFYRDSGRFDNSLATIAIAGALLLAGMLSYGALLIHRGDESGRYIVLVCAGTWAAIAVLGLFAALTDFHSDYGTHWYSGSGRLVTALFATCGIPGVVTAYLNSDWVADLAAAAVPAFTVLATTSRAVR